MNDSTTDTAPLEVTDSTSDDELLPEDLMAQYQRLEDENKALRRTRRKAVRRYNREEELKPYQAELIRMQKYLEETRTRMIILFEGNGYGPPPGL